MSVATGMTVRVTVFEVWRTISLEVEAGELVSDLKVRALQACELPKGREADYEVKYGGALVEDESQSIGAAGIPDGGSLVVMLRRRRAVR